MYSSMVRHLSPFSAVTQALFAKYNAAALLCVQSKIAEMSNYEAHLVSAYAMLSDLDLSLHGLRFTCGRRL